MRSFRQNAESACSFYLVLHAYLLSSKLWPRSTHSPKHCRLSPLRALASPHLQKNQVPASYRCAAPKPRQPYVWPGVKITAKAKKNEIQPQPEPCEGSTAPGNSGIRGEFGGHNTDSFIALSWVGRGGGARVFRGTQYRFSHCPFLGRPGRRGARRQARRPGQKAATKQVTDPLPPSIEVGRRTSGSTSCRTPAD
jgi:hypothetical protein